ncbi:MAG: HD domain-containing protein [Candidatus Thiodiazotropha sp.]
MYYSPFYTEYSRESLLPENNLIQKNIVGSKYLNEHKYEFSQNDINIFFERKVYQEIINSSAFQRLKSIHFLGAIDYLVDPYGIKPNKRHTRYQHSLGVALLALQYSRYKQLSTQDEILCVVSALLHDIGHAPLSHSMEPVLKEKFYISHHAASERIIKGEVEIGEGLHSILLKWGVNPFVILEIINGSGDKKFKEAFGLSINIDTIEAILRSQTYLYPNYLSATPSLVLQALVGKHDDSMRILDTFWNIKNEIYTRLINSRLGILADYICKTSMLNNLNMYGEHFYYKTEDDLRQSNPGLFKILKALTSRDTVQVPPGVSDIPCIQRIFYINEEISIIDSCDINKRYGQNKKSITLDIRESDKGEKKMQFDGESLKLF